MKTLIDAGLRCPSCSSNKLRGGYHEHHYYDAYICDDCGFRWEEDRYRDPDDLLEALQERPDDLKDRLIWVLHVVTKPDIPLKSTKTSDDSEYEEFIK